MTKKSTASATEDFIPNEAGQTQTLDTDFNLEEEYKADPLIPVGNYRGNVTSVVFDPEQSVIIWEITLDENGGVMSDGETPIDGSRQQYRNFLPKPGDESEMSKNGRSTKRQTKINMMSKFAEEMQVNMNTPTIIAESIANQDWVGIPVIAAIVLNEYMGVTRNQVNKMIAVE